MTEHKVPRRVLRIFSSKPTSRDPSPLPSQQPMRSLDELKPLAKQIAANADLMKRFRETKGGGDEDRAREMVDEVRNYARSIEPAITYAEGASLALLLMEYVDSEPEKG
jgi:hypothetical protein